jgi:hypothetical protein
MQDLPPVVADNEKAVQNTKVGPPGPERSQRNPEQLVQGSESTARLLPVQSQQFPTERLEMNC